jgi:hypothetical protein
MRRILFALVIFMAVSSISSGLLMITNPDGMIFGLTSALLEDTFFPDYFFPGILLTVLVGFSSLLAVYFMSKRHSRQYTWSLLAGVVLVIWIIVQMLMIHTATWLQYSFLGAGIFMILISLQLKNKWIL